MKNPPQAPRLRPQANPAVIVWTTVLRDRFYVSVVRAPSDRHRGHLTVTDAQLDHANILSVPVLIALSGVFGPDPHETDLWRAQAFEAIDNQQVEL